MTQTYKVLAQVNPLAATLTDGYTVPGATSAVLSSIFITNRSATPTSYRISIAIAGAANDNKQYIAFDVAIGANETQVVVAGVTLGAADVVRVYATLATLTFNIFGVQNA